WVASSDYKEDIRISDEIIKGLSDTYRKIRNTIRFLLGNICDFQIEKALVYKDMQEIDKYALSGLQHLVSSMTTAYESYEFHKAATYINNFCTVFLSGFYLDVLKDTLYCDKKCSRERKSAQAAIFEICSVIIRLISPILSFTAEEAWREVIKLVPNLPMSVFLADFPETNSKYILPVETLKKWEKILHVRKEVLSVYEKLRQAKLIGSNLEASLDIIYGGKYNEFFKDLKFVDLILGTCDIKCNISKKEDDLVIKAARSEYKKCVRCWRYIEGIKDNLCPRCLEVVSNK
ncbi:MAG: class I tRNA ligase family protein, partial [Endomicrobium sp.]|nr:class I tRNA ligase family protein [Endomicrobium sp.]